jgi:hypothetical protein
LLLFSSLASLIWERGFLLESSVSDNAITQSNNYKLMKHKSGINSVDFKYQNEQGIGQLLDGK